MSDKKVAVVTGAGRGLGREIALALARAGYRVAAAEISDLGADTVGEISAQGGEGLFLPTDVSDPVQLEAFVEKVKSQFGPVDVLINNAIISPVVSIADMSMDVWDRVMAVNLRGAVMLTKLLLPDLRGTSGKVVNILSGAAMGASGLAYTGAYCASKAALSSFAITLAQEEERSGVKVTAVWVGMTDTPGARSSMSELAPLINTRFQDMADALRPADQVAQAIVHMLDHSIAEYHGMAVEDHILMEEAGLISPVLPDLAGEPVAAAGENLRELAAEVLQVVQENEAKLLELPAFIRPLARRGFQTKTGRNFTGWREILQPLVNGENPGPELSGLLSGLVQYIENSPREVAKFTRDEATLKQVADAARRQSAAVQALRKAL